MNSYRSLIVLLSGLFLMGLLLTGPLNTSVLAQGDSLYDRAPIHYGTAKTNNRISRLQEAIDKGDVKLTYDKKFGYLPSLLKELSVSQKSQMLVFTKTSFQLRRIAPDRPRAVYFSDDMYVGYVQHGAVLELSAVDTEVGTAFYSLEQDELDKPKFVRHTHECTQCHASTLTWGVPGHLVRSVYSDKEGFPVLRAGTFRTDHSSPMKQRWGGWYVTGTHGKQRHMGNSTVRDEKHIDEFETETGANLTDLEKYINVRPYLQPHSDIVALMVMEHQTQMQNLITRANFETRRALWDDNVMNRMLERPDEFRSDSSKRRVKSAGEPLVEYMLFSGEAELTDQITGTSGFAEEFTALGPFDSQGRSLRQLDLKTRMMKFPCSYLIYSEPFDTLPPTVKRYVYQRLWDILTGKDKSEKFAHLSEADRQTILEILRETKKDLPDYWQVRS